MCTVITKNRQGKPSIAKEDIIVYKACNQNGSRVVSAARYFEYIKDLLYQDDFTYNTDNSISDDEEATYEVSIPLKKRCYVVKGFHAYLDEERTISWPNTVSCEFIIPKGALYYKNGSRNIVSNQIIFKRIL
jgi:hypothetical protein